MFYMGVDSALKLKKTLRVFVTISLFLLSHNVICFASNPSQIIFEKEIALPEDLEFTESNVCSTHSYFEQAAANDSGQFLTYSHHVDFEKTSNTDWEKVYIDIYNSDGTFFKELSFKTTLDFAVEFKEAFIIIYFYNYALVYNLNNSKLHNYTIPDGIAIDNGTYKELRNKNFTAGDWEYNCKKSFPGFVKLTRSNNEQTQVLIEMPSTYKTVSKIAIPGGIIGLFGMTFTFYYFKKRDNQQTDNHGMAV